MKTTEKLTGVTKASRPNKDGQPVWRFRAKGCERQLPGQPGEPEFIAAYEAAMAGIRKVADIVDLPGRAYAKSFGAAQRLLESSQEWKSYDQSTRTYNARLIEVFLESLVDADKSSITWRDAPVELMTARDLRRYIADIYETRKSTAKHTLNAIKKLLGAAIDESWIEPENDPSLSIKVRVPKSTENPAWPIKYREMFEARHPIGSAARTCYALGFWAGNRRGDVAAIEWDNLVVEEIETYDGELYQIEVLDFRQLKNRNRHGGREMFIPVVDALAAALKPLDRNKGGTILKTAYGNPFSPESLTGQMAKWTEQAGIPAGYTLHGLRRTFGTYIAECNIEARAIMDAMGHTSMAVTDEYVREANKRTNMVGVAIAINAREEKRDAAKRRGTIRLVG